MARVDVRVGTLEVAVQGDVSVVRLLGEHDMSTCEALQDRLDAEAEAHAGVVVVLVATEFIDSSTVRVLFKADTQLRESGRRLVLQVGADSVVRRVLDLANLASLVACVDSLEEAIRLASAQEGTLSV